MAGPVRSGLVEPKIATVGMPSAPARCIQPESLPRNAEEIESKAISSPMLVSPEVIAATLSWAIYGAAQEWARTPNRSLSEQISGRIVMLVSPILEQMHPNQPNDGRESA